MAVNTPYKKSTATTTNHTANYDLPLWAGEDTTSWLTQMNDAMNKIDDGMVDAKSKALEVVGIAADAKKLADETKAESAASAKIVASYNDRLTAAEKKIVEHTQDITNLNTRSDQFDVELHSVQEVQKKTTADLATLAAKVNSNKEEIDGRVTALETEVGEVSSATQSNTNAIGAINTTIESIKAKDTEQDGKIAANTTEINSLDVRVTALEDGGTKTLPTPIRNGLTLATNSSSLYTITNSVVIIEDACVYLSITFKLAGTLIPAGSNAITFDDANSPAITAIKKKFGDNVALFGSSSPLLLDPQTIAGTAKFMRFLTGGETTRVELNTNSSLSSTTATFKSSMVAVPSKE